MFRKTRLAWISHGGGGRDAALRRPRTVQARKWRLTERWIHGPVAAKCSAAERGGDGAARHPYLCFVAPGRKGHEISVINKFCNMVGNVGERRANEAGLMLLSAHATGRDRRARRLRGLGGSRN